MTSGMPPGSPRHRLGGYREYTPPPRLEGLVESVWTHNAPAELPAGAGAMHRVLPDPALNLAFSCRRDDRGLAGGDLSPRARPIREPKHAFKGW